MRTRDVMTTDVVVVFPEMSARDAARLLAERGFTALPVVDTSGALVGTVGEAELLRDRLPQDPRKLVHGEPAVPRTKPAELVDEVMTKPLTVTPSTDLAEVADLMLRHGVRTVDGRGVRRPSVHRGQDERRDRPPRGRGAGTRGRRRHGRPVRRVRGELTCRCGPGSLYVVESCCGRLRLQ